MISSASFEAGGLRRGTTYMRDLSNAFHNRSLDCLRTSVLQGVYHSLVLGSPQLPHLQTASDGGQSTRHNAETSGVKGTHRDRLHSRSPPAKTPDQKDQHLHGFRYGEARSDQEHRPCGAFLYDQGGHASETPVMAPLIGSMGQINRFFSLFFTVVFFFFFPCQF